MSYKVVSTELLKSNEYEYIPVVMVAVVRLCVGGSWHSDEDEI